MYTQMANQKEKKNFLMTKNISKIILESQSKQKEGNSTLQHNIKLVKEIEIIY